jgi:hypothetical protein
MGRVIHTASTGKRRNNLRRTIAELLRRLGQKQTIDDETKNMVAMIALCLREIEDGIDESVQAWEKRGYWMKSDSFRRDWMWVGEVAAEIEALVVSERWDDMPGLLMQLFPRFSDINVAKLTRSPKLWEKAHSTLLANISE